MKNFSSSAVLLTLTLYSMMVGVNTQITKMSHTCTTPVNELGLCIPLRNCSSLFNKVLKGTELTSADRLFLSRSQCGYNDNHPLVCCPDPSSKTVNNLLPIVAECGNYPMDRIIGGIKAELDAIPWMAVLEYSKPNNEKGFHCIGVLISKRYVLTAAHCLIGEDIPGTWNLTRVRLGEYDLLTDPDCEEFGGSLDCAVPVDVPISEKIIHEHYDPLSKNRANNIALLRLQSEIVYSDFMRPICLPRSLHLRNINYNNDVLDDSGWNREPTEYSVKLKGFVDMVNSSQCNMIYNSLGVNLHESQLCGTSKPIGYKSCQGLPGTPLMAQNKDDSYFWYLAGIEAFSSLACQIEKLPNVYTRISYFIDWIETKIHA